jgi:ubiquinone/menaquinone biosynthesis C-methylase UbiE
MRIVLEFGDSIEVECFFRYTNELIFKKGTKLLNAFPETADIETSSEDYAKRFSGKVGGWFLKIQEEATLKMLAGLPKSSILDVGGGHGQVTESLLRAGHTLTILGSDESCKKRIEKWLLSPQCRFITGNLIDLPFPEQSFDIVLSYRLLPHVAQWRKLIAELCRTARKTVIVDYPATRSINAIAPVLFKFKKQLEGNTRPFTCFKESELVEAFNSAHFSRTQRYPEFFLPMVLHRVLKAPGASHIMEQIFRYSGLTSLLGSPVILEFTRKEGMA